MDHAIIDATATGVIDGDGLDGLSGSRYAMELANRPLIRHVLSELAGSGIARATVLVGPATVIAMDQLLADDGGTPAVTLRALPGPSSRPAVALAVATLLEESGTLLHPGDCLFGPPLATLRQRFGAGDVDAVLAAEETVAGHHRAPPNLLGDSAMVLTPEARPLLQALAQRPTDSLTELLLHSGLRLGVETLDGRWAWNSSTESLLAGNRKLLDALPDTEPHPEVDEANELHGRIAVGEGVFISNCVIHGPVAIGHRAVLEDSFVGPFTAIGSDVIVSGTEIDNAIVLTGAELRHPGRRIEGSIIGPRARVTRGFELPSGLHLRLGADARVWFS